MFAELTAACDALSSTTASFVQTDMLTRRTIMEEHIKAGTITAAELRCLIAYKFVVPSASMGVAAISGMQPLLFTAIAESIKRGWDLLEAVVAPAQLHDIGRRRLRNQLTEMSRQLRRHGINIASAMAASSHCAGLLRRVHWRTAAVRALPTAKLARIAWAGGHGHAAADAAAIPESGKRKRVGDSVEERAPKTIRTCTSASAADSADCGGTYICGDARAAVDALRASMTARATRIVTPMRVQQCNPHIKRMALAWTEHVALRRAGGRGYHRRFFDGVEQLAVRGGAATACILAAMVRRYLVDYPGSYMPCATASRNPDQVDWGYARLTLLLASDLAVAWGGPVRIGYCGLLLYRIDWLVLALLLLPAGPAHPSHQQARHGVDSGTRIGVAVAALACQGVSDFTTFAVTLLACTGYGGSAIADACRSSSTCRENARFVLQSQSNAGALALMVSEAGVDAMYAVFRLMSAGVIVGPCTLLPAYASARACLPSGLATLLARRFRLPVVMGADCTRLVTAAVCLKRRGIPPELANIILLMAPYAPPDTDMHAHQEMPRIALRGVDY